MPSPNKGEKQDDFISRCMGSDEAQKTFPRQDQRAAFCFSQWRDRDKKKEACKFIIRTNNETDDTTKETA